jgi:hypothetical protein
MKTRQSGRPTLAAAKAGFSRAIAYHIEQDGQLPSQTGGTGSRPVVDLSANEIRRLTAKLQVLAGTALTFFIAWSIWRRCHQAIAKRCHWKRRAKR